MYSPAAQPGKPDYEIRACRYSYCILEQVYWYRDGQQYLYGAGTVSWNSHSNTCTVQVPRSGARVVATRIRTGSSDYRYLFQYREEFLDTRSRIPGRGRGCAVQISGFSRKVRKMIGRISFIFRVHFGHISGIFRAKYRSWYGMYGMILVST